MHFTYDRQPVRVLFGAGRRKELRDEVAKLGAKRALILTTPGRRRLGDELALDLAEIAVGVHAGAVEHVPGEAVAQGVDVCERVAADCLVAAGGGSAIGLAKAIALATNLPVIAVPTTYSGSEMTNIWGLTRDGIKVTGRSDIVKPRSVLFDPELTIGLPADISLTSGINAMAHAVEALYAENVNPISALEAEEAIRALGSGLPEVVVNPTDLNARENCLIGAWLAGSVLDGTGVALHHKLCHTLGGSFNLPHAAVHTVILPYATAYNSIAAPQAMLAISRALNVPVDDVAGGIQDISRSNGGPVSLESLGFSYSDLDRAAEIAIERPYYNPRPVTRDGIRRILKEAYRGNRP